MVTLDDRQVLKLIGDQLTLVLIPPLAEAARKYAESNPTMRSVGCGGCSARRKAAQAQAAGVFTLAQVKTVIGTLSGQHVAALKKRLNTVRYRITYVSPGKRLVRLTV